MQTNIISTTDPEVIKILNQDTSFIPTQAFPAACDGHRFKANDNAMLHGLETYPEHNGETVKILSIRQDGPRGKAYYIEGEINKALNWVYEYRLQPTK